MKPYRTLAIIRLYNGKIGLTDGQAQRRMGCLKKINDNVYEINREVVFKAGEVVGFDDIPKPYVKFLECLEPEKPVIDLKIEETVEVETKVEAKPVVKKRKYTKRKA